ncbi:hypothetical protein M2157_000860 [Streptomyces sp. SAI-127]|nr:hypothetical protein [Streptomyces sp. SAI-127]
MPGDQAVGRVTRKATDSPSQWRPMRRGCAVRRTTAWRAPPSRDEFLIGIRPAGGGCPSRGRVRRRLGRWNLLVRMVRDATRWSPHHWRLITTPGGAMRSSSRRRNSGCTQGDLLKARRAELSPPGGSRRSPSSFKCASPVMTVSVAPLGLREGVRIPPLDKPFPGWNSPLCGFPRWRQGRPTARNQDRPTENTYPKKLGSPTQDSNCFPNVTAIRHFPAAGGTRRRRRRGRVVLTQRVVPRGKIPPPTTSGHAELRQIRI